MACSEPGVAAAPAGNIYYGTCGWTDRSLIEAGSFYPAEARSPAARLRHYAEQFPLVEVDATYYAPPSEENAKLWAERTPPGFLFNVKAYGLLTHHPVAVRSLPEEVRALLPAPAIEKARVYLSSVPPAGQAILWSMHEAALRPLAQAGKLGCVLFQFPPWFRATRANRDYLRSLPDRLPWRIAVEFRGGGWMEARQEARTLELLEDMGVTYVVVDEPQGLPSSTPPVVRCTAPLAMVRFHGRNAEAWTARGLSAAERFRYLYAERELEEWVAPIRDLAAQAEQVHALMNNCYRDYAVTNARQLGALLGARPSG
jgi:uncharacterized protein YecE (DUF72 family)